MVNRYYSGSILLYFIYRWYLSLISVKIKTANRFDNFFYLSINGNKPISNHKLTNSTHNSWLFFFGFFWAYDVVFGWFCIIFGLVSIVYYRFFSRYFKIFFFFTFFQISIQQINKYLFHYLRRKLSTSSIELKFFFNFYSSEISTSSP